MNFAFLSRMFRGEPAAQSIPAKRNAYCSFCRQSYRNVGPLVEGPGDVYICEACIDLCGAIIAKEKARLARIKQPTFPGFDDRDPMGP